MLMHSYSLPFSNSLIQIGNEIGVNGTKLKVFGTNCCNDFNVEKKETTFLSQCALSPDSFVVSVIDFPFVWPRPFSWTVPETSSP